MAMVSLVYWQPTGGLLAIADRLGPKPPGTVLHSSYEPGELSQCFKHYDSTIKIILLLFFLFLLFVGDTVIWLVITHNIKCTATTTA